MKVRAIVYKCRFRIPKSSKSSAVEKKEKDDKAKKWGIDAKRVRDLHLHISIVKRIGVFVSFLLTILFFKK